MKNPSEFDRVSRANRAPAEYNRFPPMPNRHCPDIVNQAAILAFVLLISACAKVRHEDSATVASSVAPALSSKASSPSAGPPAPAAIIDHATVQAIEKNCTSICERSQELKCAHATDCLKSCVAMAIGTPCSEQFSALYTCLLREPIEHWECGDDGIAALREGYCEKEQEQTVKCMETKAQP